MNRLLHSVCGILSLAFVTACRDKNDREPTTNQESNPQASPRKAPSRTDLGAELGLLMTQFGTAVQSVSDRTTWEPAKQELARIEGRIIAITADLKTLPLPSPPESQAAIQAMKENEDKLSQALGDKTAFMQRLPKDVGTELSEAAGSFSRQMGTAQQVLYGNVTR